MDLAAAAHPRACAEYECPCRRAFSYKNNHIDELCITYTIFFGAGGGVVSEDNKMGKILLITKCRLETAADKNQKSFAENWDNIIYPSFKARKQIGHS